MKLTIALSLLVVQLTLTSADAADTAWKAGVASVDITPDHPIRLSGYAARKTESEGVEQRLFAKALAIDDSAGPALLLTVDSIGVPAHVVESVANTLKSTNNLPRERFALCSSHSHCTPGLADSIPNLFGAPLPQDQQVTLARYTTELITKLVDVSQKALASPRPANLAWGQGTASFATNRRPQKGPVDHSMPLLRVTDAQGKTSAVLVNYACHCTTLGGDFNRITGDWAGYAQARIEADHPGVVAMIAIGCGADANPMPRGKLEQAKQYGEQIAAETKRLLTTDLKPLPAPLTPRFKRMMLSFDKEKLPTSAQWEELAKKTDAIGSNARLQLQRLKDTGAIQTQLPYSLQTWAFGDQLAMVFLPGEVVVDYSVRLKKELDGNRLWINAYANDVPCYIPSKRILNEGGYEAEGAMTYYGLPGRLAPETEDQIVTGVTELLSDRFTTPK